MHTGWLNLNKFPKIPATVDLRSSFYANGVICRLLNDVPGFDIGEDYVTDVDVIRYTDARLFFPRKAGSIIGWEEKTFVAPVRVWNQTFYDLSANEECWVYELGQEWVIHKPVLPETAYFLLTEDLYPDDQAEAETAWGLDTIFAPPQYIAAGKYFPAGTYGFCARGKIGYYAMTFNKCAVAQP
jgi:hypothetical protein